MTPSLMSGFERHRRRKIQMVRFSHWQKGRFKKQMLEKGETEGIVMMVILLNG